MVRRRGWSAGAQSEGRSGGSGESIGTSRAVEWKTCARNILS